MVLLILFFTLALLYTAFGSFNYYRTPSEILADPSLDGKRIKVAGKLSGQIDLDADGGNSFVISDGKSEIAITYDKSLPPNLTEETEIIIEGTYDHQTGIVTADSALTKCPSKYSSK